MRSTTSLPTGTARPAAASSAAGALPASRKLTRKAQPHDVMEIVALVNGFASEGLMLPVTEDSVALALPDFVVAVDPWERVLACGALKEYSPTLAEVSSVAVHRRAHGSGLGRAIVREVEAMARSRGIDELLALTLEPGFFAALGYVVVERTRYPEKIRRDCLGCPRRDRCAEICVWRPLPR